MFGLDKGRARLRGLLCIGYELRDKVFRGYAGFKVYVFWEGLKKIFDIT